MSPNEFSQSIAAWDMTVLDFFVDVLNELLKYPTSDVEARVGS